MDVAIATLKLLCGELDILGQEGDRQAESKCMRVLLSESDLCYKGGEMR